MSEEVHELILGLLRNIIDVLDVCPARVLGLHADDLLVDAAVVFHRKNADWANVNDDARENWEL